MTQYKIIHLIKNGITTTSELRFAESAKACRKEFLQDNDGMKNSDIVRITKTGIVK